MIITWYLEGVNFADAPTSIAELNSRFKPRIIPEGRLANENKWEPLIRGEEVLLPKGWTMLASLAKFRRGIATGSNDFFLINRRRVAELGLRNEILRKCVGRSNDVRSIIFNDADFAELDRRNAKCHLIDFRHEPTPNEMAYIKSGELQGLTSRYLLTARRPWYSMEQRDPAPIWASVFSRGDLEFVYNEANVRSLTNFHCVYPQSSSAEFARALTLVLNSRVVRKMAKSHTRGYGGGLTKFEPNDLRSIPVPDLRNVHSVTLQNLSRHLVDLDKSLREHRNLESLQNEVDRMTLSAGQEAASTKETLF